MDSAVLAREIAKLENSLDWLEWWFEFWTAMVVIGLIVEYAVPIKELITKRPFDWKLFREAVGGLLITAGVAGELLVGFQLSTVETDLRTANGKLIALLQKDANEAIERVANATKEAQQAGERARTF